MSFQNNLQEQLGNLSKRFRECQFSGFQYAESASTDMEAPAVYCFDTVKTLNSRNSSKQSVSDIGFLDLQMFRSERTDATSSCATSSAFLTSEPSVTNTVQLPRHTSVTIAPPPAPPVATTAQLPRHTSVTTAPPPALPRTTVAPMVDSAFLESELMDLDIDALVAAELAKQQQKSHQPSGSTYREAPPGPVPAPNSSFRPNNGPVMVGATVTPPVASGPAPAVMTAPAAPSTEELQARQRFHDLQRTIEKYVACLS
jgi:hypothetical protein